MHQVVALLDEAVARGLVPSASICIRVAGDEVLHHTVGNARLAPERIAAPDQAYDLASVTKVLCGAAVAAALVEAGTLQLDQHIEDVFPDVDERITLRHLLSHTAGYPAWRALYEGMPHAWGTEAARRELLRRARTTPLDAPPGRQHTYSDLGYLVLLDLIESVTGQSLATLFEQRVLQPAGLKDLHFGWPTAAATEWPCPVREIGIEGTVHDLNAAALGGVSTHAGLFGTARAVARLGEAFLEATRGAPRFSGLPGATLRSFWSEPGIGSHRLGWDGNSAAHDALAYTSSGALFPLDAVGHLGYTGTSVWIAPRQRVTVALLTNRVHPVDDKGPIRALRPAVHDAIAAALGWTERP